MLDGGRTAVERAEEDEECNDGREDAVEPACDEELDLELWVRGMSTLD